MLLSRQSLVSMGAITLAIILALAMLAPTAFAANNAGNDDNNNGDNNGKVVEPTAKDYKGWTEPDRPTYICQLLGNGKLRCEEITAEDKAFGRIALQECVIRQLSLGHPAAALTCFIPRFGLPVFTITPEQQIPG